jgi:hypothetical protein
MKIKKNPNSLFLCEKDFKSNKKFFFLRISIRNEIRNFFYNYLNWFIFVNIERKNRNLKFSEKILKIACLLFPLNEKLWLEFCKKKNDFMQKNILIFFLKKKFFFFKMWLQLIYRENFFIFLKENLKSFLCFFPKNLIFLNLSYCLFSFDLFGKFMIKFKRCFYKLIFITIPFFQKISKSKINWPFFFLNKFLSIKPFFLSVLYLKLYLKKKTKLKSFFINFENEQFFLCFLTIFFIRNFFLNKNIFSIYDEVFKFFHLKTLKIISEIELFNFFNFFLLKLKKIPISTKLKNIIYFFFEKKKSEEKFFFKKILSPIKIFLNYFFFISYFFSKNFQFLIYINFIFLNKKKKDYFFFLFKKIQKFNFNFLIFFKSQKYKKFFKLKMKKKYIGLVEKNKNKKNYTIDFYDNIILLPIEFFNIKKKKFNEIFFFYKMNIKKKINFLIMNFSKKIKERILNNFLSKFLFIEKKKNLKFLINKTFFLNLIIY